MFHKLHLQMTIFSTAITSAILILLTVICLPIAEKGLRDNYYNSFSSEASSILSHLQAQDVLSLQWLNQLREKNHFTFLFYDNGAPLFSQNLTAPEQEINDALLSKALSIAKDDYHIDLFAETNSILPSHAEFPLKDVAFYVSAGTVPKKGGTLSFLIFYSLTGQERQILNLRLAFAATDFAALLLLAVFSYFFTGRMLKPIMENNRKQSFFIASASHELRTPLAVILSGIEALEKSENAAERSHFTGIMRHEGMRMQRLISDMLVLSNSDASALTLHCQSCQPDELLLTAYEKYELLAQKKQISLVIQLPETSTDNSADFTGHFSASATNTPAVPDCFCDPERILEVLSILLDNALSYTPAGGTVTLALSVKNGICFQVSDTGCGIADADKAAIFERFYRAEDSRTNKEHFGLGLCIAKEIVEAHHGKIAVTDVLGGGTLFSITLKKER